MKLLAGLLALIGAASPGMATSRAAPQASGAPFSAPASAAATAPAAAAADQHQHGIARLRIVVEGSLLNLRLRAPLESLAGFEATPRTARQRHALKDMAARLREAQWLFASPMAAECALQEVGLASDVVPAALLAAGPDVPAGNASERGSPERPAPAAGSDGRKPAGRRAGTRSENPAVPAHADLEATISFKCANPQALTGLQVRLFDAFPRLRQIDAEILTPRGRSGARLSPNRTGLTW